MKNEFFPVRWDGKKTLSNKTKPKRKKKLKNKKKKQNVYQSSYGKRVAYIPYWSDTYGPGLGVFVFTFEPDVVVELVWCGGPCNTSSYNRDVFFCLHTQTNENNNKTTAKIDETNADHSSSRYIIYYIFDSIIIRSYTLLSETCLFKTHTFFLPFFSRFFISVSDETIIVWVNVHVYAFNNKIKNSHLRWNKYFGANLEAWINNKHKQ